MIEGDVSLGQYIRSIGRKSPFGAGSQFGVWFWIVAQADGELVQWVRHEPPALVDHVHGDRPEAVDRRRRVLGDSKIQAGAISYSRGVIKILDLDALNATSCECYEALREQNGD